MGLRFSRRISLIPGLRMNLSKHGASFSVGPRGAWLTVGPRVHRARQASLALASPHNRMVAPPEICDAGGAEREAAVKDNQPAHYARSIPQARHSGIRGSYLGSIGGYLQDAVRTRIEAVRARVREERAFVAAMSGRFDYLRPRLEFASRRLDYIETVYLAEEVLQGTRTIAQWHHWLKAAEDELLRAQEQREQAQQIIEKTGASRERTG
jgi:Protein of unknown function (DUF4236)